MHIERIRFERVFDIQPGLGMFSFASAGAVTYSVHLPGRTIPREGATWTVAFGQPGDWSTLLGWRDLAAQRTTLAYRLHHVLSDIDLVYWLGLPLLVFSTLVGGGMGRPGGGTGRCRMRRLVAGTRRAPQPARARRLAQGLTAPSAAAC